MLASSLVAEYSTLPEDRDLDGAYDTRTGTFAWNAYPDRAFASTTCDPRWLSRYWPCAAFRAANRNLADLFSGTWRWPVSAAARNEVRALPPAPLPPRTA